MRVVLDTNVLVSALLWRGAAYRCPLAVQAGLADLDISPPILEELRTVVVTKFRHTATDADEAIGLVRAAAEWANGRSPGKNTLTTRQGWFTAPAKWTTPYLGAQERLAPVDTGRVESASGLRLRSTRWLS